MIELELRDVDISSTGWYNVTIYLNDYNARSANALNNLTALTSGLTNLTYTLTNVTNSQSRAADALEEIANKTGTFHFSVVCDPAVTVGNNINCNINAQVEANETMQKEVDFTCYIDNGGVRNAEQNWNQMVNKTMITMPKYFSTVNLTGDYSYQLKCEAGYYNLGSRTDTFYTTFNVNKVLTGSYIISGNQSIATGITSEAGGSNWFYYILIGLMLLCLLIFYVRKRRGERNASKNSNEQRTDIPAYV